MLRILCHINKYDEVNEVYLVNKSCLLDNILNRI